MADVLPIPSGPTNREIIDRAYRALGLSDSMFGRTPEEYASAMDILASLMLESPFDRLGYISGNMGEGDRVADESGVDRKYMNAVSLMLAEQLAPMIGKQLSPHTIKTKNRAYSALCAAVVTIPEAQYADGTQRGAGHRYYNNLGPYFSNGND